MRCGRIAIAITLLVVPAAAWAHEHKTEKDAGISQSASDSMTGGFVLLDRAFRGHQYLSWALDLSAYGSDDQSSWAVLTGPRVSWGSHDLDISFQLLAGYRREWSKPLADVVATGAFALDGGVGLTWMFSDYNKNGARFGIRLQYDYLRDFNRDENHNRYSLGFVMRSKFD